MLRHVASCRVVSSSCCTVLCSVARRREKERDVLNCGGLVSCCYVMLRYVALHCITRVSSETWARRTRERSCVLFDSCLHVNTRVFAYYFSVQSCNKSHVLVLLTDQYLKKQVYLNNYVTPEKPTFPSLLCNLDSRVHGAMVVSPQYGKRAKDNVVFAVPCALTALLARYLGSAS